MVYLKKDNIIIKTDMKEQYGLVAIEYYMFVPNNFNTNGYYNYQTIEHGERNYEKRNLSYGFKEITQKDWEEIENIFNSLTKIFQ